MTHNSRPAGGSLILGEVVRFHFERAIIANGRIDAAKLSAVGRMGGNEYTWHDTRDQDSEILISPPES